MRAQDLVSPKGTTRLVVTLPGEQSRFEDAFKRHAGEAFTTLTDTHDAFTHIARRAVERLVIMVPFIDKAGAAWAAELFEATPATQRLLILRDASQLGACGQVGSRLKSLATGIFDYCLTVDSDGAGLGETFHAKVVLADGVCAYVGSANLLRRSRHSNLECGILVEGPGALAVSVLVDTVLVVAKRVELG
jgi:hypothetical protein